MRTAENTPSTPRIHSECPPPISENIGKYKLHVRPAVQALREGGAVKAALLQGLAENLARRQELCLRMEIAAGVESPPEFQQARMEFQANRLAEAIGHGEADPVGELEDLQRAWHLSGCGPNKEDEALQARVAAVDRAIDAGASKSA